MTSTVVPVGVGVATSWADCPQNSGRRDAVGQRAHWACITVEAVSLEQGQRHQRSVHDEPG